MMLTSIDSAILVLARVYDGTEIRVEHGLFRRFLKNAFTNGQILATRGEVEHANEASNGRMSSHRDAYFRNE